MSLKNLFSKISSKHILPESSVNDLLEDIESGRYIDEYIKRKARFLPHIDYATASNFARFGLAEEYYDSAARRIYQTYPYDGSSYEKIKWINNSNGLDLYVFDNEYPRTHGHARFSPTGWGSRTSLSGNYGNPATKEYIYIKGGPNVDNIWHTASNRTSNLEIDGNKGNTVEFWLKKSAFQALTKREVVFDAWTTGSVPSGHQYGRLTIELDRTRPQEDSPWVVTYQSASSGVKNLYVSGTAGLYASASDGEWHHYAFSFQNTGSQVNFRLHVDGDLNHSVLTGSSIGNLNTAIVANIGALVAAKDSDPQPRLGPSTTTNPGLGFGKLSGSIDEFRFWKAKRSSKDIGRHWFTQVHGGTNTDDPNTDLGVYYKFNEGITLTSSIDQIALDYSGRISNGTWTGYTSDSRSTKSAMIQSSASLTEFAEPIIHTENPKVNEYLDDILEKGRNYDINNNSSIYKSVPGWILEEDDEGELKQLTQIMGAYFDELFMQIQSLSKLKHIKSENYSKKPLPFMDKILKSMGFETPEIFINADVLASLASRDEEKEFEQRLEDVKNVIYQNIYNNLVHIYKSKGTEKSFRNLLRCYGIDEEIIKINTYADGVDYPIEQNYRVDSFKTRCINFNRSTNFSSTIYQYSSSLHHSNNSSDFPVSGYITGAHAHDSTVGLSFTTEAEVVFPIRHRAGTALHFDTPISSSLFGAHTVLDSHGGTHDLTWKAAAKDFANFEVYAVKDREDSRHAKFVVKSTSGIVAPVETGIYYDVYDGNKWNFAVRVAPKGTFGNTISGSTNSYNLELFGVKTDAGEVKEEFLLTSSLTNAQGQRFHQYSKRLYAGAHRRNFTGSTIDLSDVQLSSLRHWMSYLDNETIRSHALDPKSYGVAHPMRNAYTFMPGLDNPVPTIETLALDWGFNTVTGSTKGGQLIIRDFSSGSLKNKRDYGWIGDVISSNHPGRGDFFPSETTASVSVAYLQTARQQILENVHSSDMIKILTRDDTTYTRESRPVNHFFSIEKSMYQAISEEMLDMFATIKDFSNLIGDPVNRYRPNYKAMEKLRSLFFERVENTPSIEKYIEFYKWIDASISQVLDQLKPASANFSEDVRTMIESHVLERNKYWTKFPTLEGKQADPEPGQVKSVGEMLYNWRYGHAPLQTHTGIYRPSGSLPENENCLWWRDRASRKDAPLATGIAATDAERETLRRVAIADVSGSTYALRRLTKPYRFKLELQPVLHGGDNFHLNKKKDLYLGTSNPGALDFIRISGSDVTFAGGECTDVYNPRINLGAPYSTTTTGEAGGGTVIEKKKAFAKADISNTNSDHDLSTIAPFSLYSSSIDDPKDYKAEIYDNFKKGVDITNLHSDAYGDDREIPIQSPFTEHWVGGHSHRHQHLNMMRPKIPQADPGLQNITMSLDHAGRRFEGFNLTMSQGQLYVTSPNLYALNHEPPGTFHVSLTSSTHNRSRILRDPLAKRPVNIRNIKTTASEYAKDTTLNIGNYKHEYEIVQGTSVEMNPVFLVRTASTEPVENTSNSPFFVEINERRKFERPTRKNVFVNRFSAPGGPETAGDSLGGPGLDIATNQYSVYNSLNYRNMMPRMALDEWSMDRAGKFGHASNSSITASSPTASYHKVYHNPRYVATASWESGVECRMKHDNQFVQHQIPQSDLGYAWIKNSTTETTCSYARLESKFTYPKAQSDQTVYETNEANAVDFDSPGFVSASDIGFGHYGANGRVLTTRPDILGGGSSLVGLEPVDFAGLNFIVVEPISSSYNLLGYDDVSVKSVGGVYSRVNYLAARDDGARFRSNVSHGTLSPDAFKWDAHLLNAILSNRNGPYGYPSWKQLRAGQHPVARKLRRDNIMAPIVERDGALVNSFSPAYFTRGDYSWPDNIDHQRARTSRTISAQRYRFTESAVTSKFGPLKTTMIGKSVAGLANSYGSWRDAHSAGGTQISVGGKVTHGNDLVTFSNQELVNFLQIDEKASATPLRDKIGADIIQTLYSETIYPRDSNSYSNRVRGRENFIIDWWKPKRADRQTIDKHNSQGLHIGLTSSMWPLDAQTNFGTSNEIALGTDIPGAFGEGELMSSYCLFRSGGVGLGAYPTASAMYARKFPEENYIFNLTFNTTVTEKYWGGASDGDHTSYYIQFYPPEASAVVHYIYFCRTAETASVNNADSITTGANKIWIPLSESSYTTTTLASAVKDGLNSNSIFKKVATAESSTNKLSLHFKGTWDNSYVGGDYLGDEFSDTTFDAQFSVSYLDLSPVFLSGSSNTSTYLAGAAKWEAGEMAGRDPFNYKDYDDYAMQMRLIGKEYSIVPEYRISEEMPNYIGRAAADPYFSCPQADFLQMTGALDDFADSSKSDFFKVYGHSDFIKYFDIVKEGHKELAMSENSLTLRCKAMKKFLPYEGIYPAQRTLQLATMFSESYGPQTNVAVEKFGQTKGGYEPYGSWRTALQPFYAPGIAYNSIKSGIAVDYPVFTPNRDRKFNLFCTTFDKQDNNHINIGQASEWAQLISGSHSKNSSAANSGLSISMWVYFDEDPDADANTDTSGSLLVFKDDDNATEGIHFTKHGGRLMLSMYTDASNYKKWWTKPYKSLTTADKWYHVAVAKKFDTSTPDFYIDGVQIETQGAATAAGITGTAGSLTETSVNMDGHSTTATGNCTIGNHRYGHTNTNHALNAMEVAISEVSIFNTKLTDESVRGLFGGGVRQRGPWRPDLCVEQPHVDNLIGWFRMGNDTGYVMAGTSGSITMTNNLGLNNHAMPLYRKTLVGGGKGSLAGVETTTKGKFVGFTDAWSAGAQTGYGITLLGENGVDTNMELTGAFQYPSYITGSAFNETSDFGIPRIGSASWGEHQAKGADPELAEATSYWTQGDYGRNFGTWGVQRVERLPFEVIIDPTRLVTNTVKNIGIARNVARLDERFTFYEMEPHPSASLQPCSFLRSRSSGSADTGARHLSHLSTTVPETYWGATHQTPITSSMLTASFSLSRMRVLSDTTYSKAANNFFAESSRFFLEGGHTTTIASEDTLQTAVDPSKTYKFRLRLNRPNTQDFPMYNRAAAFGPPVNAGPGDDGNNRASNYVGHGFAPYTPPHYDNYAEVEYIFNPSVGVSYETIEDVLNRITEQNSLGTATINYNRYIQGTGSKNNFGISGITNSDYVSGPGISTDFQSINAATASLNKTHAMQLSASFYGMDLAQGSLVPIFEGTERDRDILRKSWVIQSKWETPNMDFRKTTPAKAKPHYITTAKGMWHQTGAYDDPSSFIEIMPPIDGSEDLSRLLGVHFRKGERKIKEQRALSIGQLPEERKVSEAVVAIPFVEDESGNRKFFNIPKNEVYKAVQNEGYPNYKKAYLDTVEGRRLRHGRGRNKGTTTEVVANPISSRTSIQTMVGKMLKYVIPPKMNFLKYNNEEEKFVHPFAMYIFEFEHTLSKSDLAYMWQNLPPDVALNDFHNNDDDTLQAESVVSHDLGGATDLLDGSFNKNVKWMVFKVKQRAETNYFKKISRDKLPVGHPERELSVENDIFEYGYNWPYDYFSLVELVKIDAGVSFAKDRDIVEPLTPEQAEQTARAVAGLVPQENEEGEQEVDFKNLFPKEDE